MQIFHHRQSVRDALEAEKSSGRRIALVPTMGNLHDGHMALIERAHELADVVIVSIFVNRLQFGLNEDWDRYPRTLEQDVSRLNAAKVDFLFCPDEQEIYPNGMDEQTRVIVPSMSDILCGASRPGHFEGVTTVVSKLFNIVQADCAVFGIKDFQQLAIIRRMVEDMCIPIELVSVEIARENDGLARSSRNSFILDGERLHASQLYKSLIWVKEAIESGEAHFDKLIEQAITQIETVGFNVDYFKICESKTLAPAADDDVLITILGAMYTERARLIDNVSLERRHVLQD